MPITRRTLLASGMAAAAAGALPPALAARPWPPAGTSRFAIYRKGSEIGRHAMTLDGGPQGWTVRNEIRIEVTLMGFVVYRYTHTSAESWTRDGLARVDSVTDDDGEIAHVAAQRRGATLVVTGPAGQRRLDPDQPTTSLWHPDTTRVTRLLDIADGGLTDIQPGASETDSMPLPGVGSIPCRRYALRDRFQREVWYDDDNRLIAAAFVSAEDGSRIEARPLQLAGI